VTDGHCVTDGQTDIVSRTDRQTSCVTDGHRVTNKQLTDIV